MAFAGLRVAPSKELPYIATMIISRLTSKAQTTVPQSVRTALRLREGDSIAYAIEQDRVVLTRAPTGEDDDPFRSFAEWDGAADREAYAGL